MSSDREADRQEKPKIAERPDGWWVLDAADQPIAGPFRTLREVEDWLDYHDVGKE